MVKKKKAQRNLWAWCVQVHWGYLLGRLRLMCWKGKVGQKSRWLKVLNQRQICLQWCDCSGKALSREQCAECHFTKIIFTEQNSSLIFRQRIFKDRNVAEFEGGGGGAGETKDFYENSEVRDGTLGLKVTNQGRDLHETWSHGQGLNKKEIQQGLKR